MTSPLDKRVVLSSGQSMPIIGFGTFQPDANAPTGACKAAVQVAFQIGIRHIDTAYSYGTEEEVGEAIRESGVPRENLFVVTKLHQTFHDPVDVETGLNISLERMGLSYVDLFLMHFPHAYKKGPGFSTLRHPNGKPVIDHPLSKRYTDTWKAMESLVSSQKTRSIGVSNFSVLKLSKLLKSARVPPAVNQVELHPYLPQTELLNFCRQHNIHVTAHSPLGGAPVGVVAPYAGLPGPLHDPVIEQVAQARGVSAGQILLSWAVQRGTSVVPKSNLRERVVQNTSIIELSDKEMSRINSVREGKGWMRRSDPKAHIGFDIYNEEVEEPKDESN